MDGPDSTRRARDRGSAMIAAALLGSAAILSYGLWSATPRYQLAASGDAVVRMDVDSSAMIACNLRGCAQVQPPDRARALQPVARLIGGSGSEAAPKQLKGPGS